MSERKSNSKARNTAKKAVKKAYKKNPKAFIIGAILSTDEISQDNKKQVYAAVQEFTALFRQKNGTIICRELLANANVPVEKGGEAEVRREEYYKKRPCPQIVADAANCLQEYLHSKNII
jgi:hypothetical protein